MQAIHNNAKLAGGWTPLFQRAKIQDKCKQFTTQKTVFAEMRKLFQRAKIQDKCKQFTTNAAWFQWSYSCFKEQRYKINASNSQRKSNIPMRKPGCFKKQRYKINASNSQLPNRLHLQICLMVALDERQAAADFVAVVVDGAADAGVERQVVEWLPFS